ncbi:hypothetical protein K488DRAFT_24437, partial [Vararia minispora EC-137]
AGAPPTVPRLSRAFSVPLPSQIGYLQNPRRRTPPDSSRGSSPAPSPVPELAHFHELSLELADSVQMVIQTLLQLSPPQVLDPAKEQFSACSLPIPTPSVSAMLTAMKNLNYMSANMPALCAELGDPRPPDPPPGAVRDFDIGETLQSVGDALGGLAADAGVDLVLYHGDVGMKHVAVKGDENGISYTLSHIVRHIMATAWQGDAVEIGLFLVAPAQAPADDPNIEREIPLDATDVEGNALPDPDAPLRCTFQITHVYGTPDADATRDEPTLDSYILRRLLRHIDATFVPLVTPTACSCKLSLTLERGSPAVVNPALVLPDPDPILQMFPDLRIAGEPTLEELAQFTEILKGKRVHLYAASQGLFARHLTSYLTSWGLDVSPVSTDRGERGSPERPPSPSPPPADHPPPTNEAYSGTAVLSTLPEADATSVTSASPSSSMAPPSASFIIIDDDVVVLKERLRKIRADQGYPLYMSSSRTKRPSLAAHHRPRSSPQVARAMSSSGLPTMSNTNSVRPSPSVIVHFTSLSNFKLVKGILQSVLAPSASSGTLARLPEVIVIPKPAGPRRVLTALHTAATKPIVDPFFTPIATSPLSPGLHLSSSYFSMTSGTSPKSPMPPGRTGSSPRSYASSSSNRSPPGPGMMSDSNILPPSPLGLSEGMDYFSEVASKLSAPSSGLVIQSPDGQPAGIFFHPRLRGSRVGLTASQLERDRGHQHTSLMSANGVHMISWRQPQGDAESERPSTGPSATSRRSSANSNGSGAGVTDVEQKRDRFALPPSISVRSPSAPSAPPLDASEPSGSLDSPMLATSAPRSPTAIRKVSPVEGARKNTPPGTPRVGRRGSVLRAAAASVGQGGPSEQQQHTTKKSQPGIVPPINVLVVEDNPINQAILTTFMRRKQIKYDVAKNGEEAIGKWKSGKFHLILMDIQMPVMDGITATKEIRRLERVNAMQGFPSTPSTEGQRTPDTPLTNSTSASPYRSSVIIVALTASSLQSDRVTALAAGCNDFLTKPVSLDWLNSKIIEWGSIKALQMWADIKPETARSFVRGQNAQAEDVARKLRVPEGRATPGETPSRATSVPRSPI